MFMDDRMESALQKMFSCYFPTWNELQRTLEFLLKCKLSDGEMLKVHEYLAKRLESFSGCKIFFNGGQMICRCHCELKKMTALATIEVSSPSPEDDGLCFLTST